MKKQDLILATFLFLFSGLAVADSASNEKAGHMIHISQTPAAISINQVQKEIQIAKEALIELQEIYESGEKTIIRNETAYKIAVGAETLGKYATVLSGSLAIVGGVGFLVKNFFFGGLSQFFINVGATSGYAFIPTGLVFLFAKGGRKLLEKEVVLSIPEQQELIEKISEMLDRLEALNSRLLEVREIEARDSMKFQS